MMNDVISRSVSAVKKDTESVFSSKPTYADKSSDDGTCVCV